MTVKVGMVAWRLAASGGKAVAAAGGGQSGDSHVRAGNGEAAWLTVRASERGCLLSCTCAAARDERPWRVGLGQTGASAHKRKGEGSAGLSRLDKEGRKRPDWRNRHERDLFG